ncbi:MAG: hypothetical protein QM817_20835 [Archangium sp.]
MDGPAVGTKGTHIIQARGWVDAQLGAGAFDRFAAEAGVASELSKTTAMRWYSVPALVKTLSLVGQKLNLSLRQVSGEVAKQNAKHDLKTIYRVFMTVVGPVNVLKRSEAMYSTYQNFGAAKTTRNEPGHYECLVTGIPIEVVEWSVGVGPAFLAAAATAAGGKNAISEATAPTADASGICSWSLSLKYG